MTTGRWVVLALSLLLAAGCTIQPAGKRTQSAWVQREVSPAFSTVVSADQLGDDWQDDGCWQMVTDIHAMPAGDRVLLLRRGGDPLWIDGGRVHQLASSRKLHYLELSDLAAVAVERRFPESHDRLLSRTLPNGKWREAMVGPREGGPDGQIIAVSGHPLNPRLWIGTQQYDADSSPRATAGWVSSEGVYTTLVGSDPNAAAQSARPVALADGDALAIVDGAVWFIDGSGESAEEIYPVPPGRNRNLTADSTDAAVGWLMIEPQQRGAGTARVSGEVEPGYLVALNTHGAELARINTGSVKFTNLYGDWQNRRALLLHPSIGVALANAQTGELSWLLRQSGAAQLQLLPGGQVWAFVPDGIIGIEGDDLIRLAPKLAAGEVLTRDQLAQIKPVAEALRWRWDDVQLSPLVHEAGHLTFFNAGEVDADWAEFDWDLSLQLVSRLLIARQPAAADLKLLGLTGAQLDEQVLAMLTALGWPEAARAAERGTHGADELNAFYSLSPEGEAGEFQLWITSGATMLKLTAADDTATQEIPTDGTGEEPAQ